MADPVPPRELYELGLVFEHCADLAVALDEVGFGLDIDGGNPGGVLPAVLQGSQRL
jgi:hypothetical protein